MATKKAQELTVKLNIGELIEATETGKDLVLNPKAEQGILKLLQMATMVGQAIELVKSEIARQGLDRNPNFTCVVGDNVKANYSAGGARYKANMQEVKHPYAPLWQRRVIYSINAKAVEQYEIKHRGRLPKGMSKAERNKSIQFKIKEA